MLTVETTYNLFVGGNKLGRGVTIKNLLVSYYGRHPRNPQADTVLQHAANVRISPEGYRALKAVLAANPAIRFLRPSIKWSVAFET